MIYLSPLTESDMATASYFWNQGFEHEYPSAFIDMDTEMHSFIPYPGVETPAKKRSRISGIPSPRVSKLNGPPRPIYHDSSLHFARGHEQQQHHHHHRRTSTRSIPPDMMRKAAIMNSIVHRDDVGCAMNEFVLPQRSSPTFGYHVEKAAIEVIEDQGEHVEEDDDEEEGQSEEGTPRSLAGSTVTEHATSSAGPRLTLTSEADITNEDAYEDDGRREDDEAEEMFTYAFDSATDDDHDDDHDGQHSEPDDNPIGLPEAIYDWKKETVIIEEFSYAFVDDIG